MDSELLMINTKRGNMKKFSSVISFIFNPLLIAVYVFSSLIFSHNHLAHKEKWILWFVTLFFVTILPTIYLMNLRKRKEIQSLDIDDRKKRIVPLLLGFVCFSIGFIILYLLNAPGIVLGLMFCYVSNTLIVWLITIFWKVSVHAIGVSGPMMALFIYFGQYVLPLFIIVVLIGMSRIVLNKHTPMQVMVGTGIGLLLTPLQIHCLFL
jgi:membrane-associated phospholipid phosphatase